MNTNTAFKVIGGQGKVIYQSRDGLVAKATIQGNTTKEALLRLV